MRQRYRSLNDYFEQTGENQGELARRVRISPTYVSLIASGKRHASPEVAAAIHKDTGVAVESLLHPDVFKALMSMAKAS